VRPVSVVVLRIDVNYSFEVTAAEDQQPVEALAAEPFDAALGVRTRTRRPHRRLDHADALGAEHLVEAGGELTVSVADQEALANTLVIQPHDQIARLLRYPGPVRVGRDAGDPHAPARKLDEEEDLETPQEHRVDGKEVALDDARRLPAEKLPPAGVEPPRRRLDARLAQNRPDGAGREPDPEPDKLTLDPPIPPAGILASQPQHQLTHSGWRPRTARATMSIRPPARHQLAMPAQQCRRRHEERRPRRTRKRATERSQQSAITSVKLRTYDLAFQHLQLVAQDENLNLLAALRPHPQDVQLQQPPQHPVQK
jgi:hypothetical protein